MSRFDEIHLPDDKRGVQLNLFLSPGVAKTVLNKTSPYPAYGKGEKWVQKVLDNPDRLIGIDLEFDSKSGKPSILGVANSNFAASGPWNADQARYLVNLCIKGGHRLVGYSINGAEKAIMEKALKMDIPLEIFEDSMVAHYLLSQDLCKTSERGESEKGSLGFMNLWTMASLYTDLPMWKRCRELSCEGPCPKHDVWGYNAVDTWAGLKGFQVMAAEMKRKGVPYGFYRDMVKLGDIAHRMQEKGVYVNMELAKSLDELNESEKDSIFEFELQGKKKIYKYFNPQSPKAAMEWFHGNGIDIKSWTKKDLLKAVEKFGDLEELLEADNLTIPVEQLVKAAQFKGAGKGFKAWFDAKYLGDDGYLHPRFVYIGTSTGRWSSSRPNFQNIPSFPDDVPLEQVPLFSKARLCIEARHKDLELIKYDKSQLELRMVLSLSGIDSREITGDAFSWLVQKAPGAFKRASDLLGRDERFVAKSVGHAGNYLEGITLISEKELGTKKVQQAIAAGALRVYTDWVYCGKYVAFTGSNLASRLFGDSSFENRKLAHTIQEDIYFANFPSIRKWHREILEKIERDGILHSVTGRFLELNGSPLENAKVGAAFLGQGTSADHVQGDILLFESRFGDEGIPLLQVHDELVFEKPKTWMDKECVQFMSLSEGVDIRIPGFWCPVKMYRGSNWGQMRRIK